MKKKHAILLLKILFIACALSFVFYKADSGKIFGYLKNISPAVVLASLLALGAAQAVSALRMRYYFSKEGVTLNRRFSTGLYFTSMLFNNILPGGIGGDGYKIYLINKLAGISHLAALRVAFSERASGLFALMALAIVCFHLTGIYILPYQGALLTIAFILLVPAYFVIARLILKEKAATSCIAAIYSLVIQLLGIIAFAILIYGMGAGASFMPLLAIFLISSVLAVLPVSVGGIGIREITFLYGAQVAGIEQETGIALALLYFFVNLLCSLNGLAFWSRLKGMYGRSATTTVSNK